MKFYLGSYAISPCASAFDEKLEGPFIEGLKALPFVAGIEIPFFAALHKWDEDFFFRHADPCWDYVVNTIPAIMGIVRSKPTFGLASTDDEGRKAAIAVLEKVNASVRRRNDLSGLRAVRAVEIHSAPSSGRLNGGASAASFARAMAEIGRWQWDGAEILVEHCDAALPGQPIQKGFLTVEEEIEAISGANRQLDRPIGAVLNWGRSVIEGRSTSAVTRHTGLLQAAGLMRAMIFSGASGADNAYGAWQDTHMPHGPEPYIDAFEVGALLTEQEIRASLAQTRGTDLAFLGVKVAVRPDTAPIKRRLDLLRSALTVTAAGYLAVR